MATARSIIQDAYGEIGVYQPNEPLTAADAQIGLRYFQRLLNSWQAEQAALNLLDREVFTLASGTSTFTIGSGGDLDVVRPVYVNGVNYIVPGSTAQTGSVEVALAPLQRDQYMMLSIKDLVSGLPQQFFYNQTVPLGTMFIWPTVNQDVDLAIYLLQGIAEPATLDSTVIGPQGYAEAFHYNLALRLCNPMGKPVPVSLPAMASSAYQRMMRPNVDPGMLGVDAAVTDQSGGAFNVLTGNFTGPSN